MDKPKLEAFEALDRSYIKILKANLTKDNFIALKLDEKERSSLKGYSDQLSTWFIDFALSGQVYFDDLELYSSSTKIENLRNFLLQNNGIFSFRYRRLFKEEYKWVIFEMIPAPEYTPENQVVFLFLRNVNDAFVTELDVWRELELTCNTDSLTGIQNLSAYKTKCIRFENTVKKTGAIAGAIFCDLNGLKLVNDTKGHNAGNQFICHFANVLKEIFYPEEIFRLSGDEFLVVLLSQSQNEIQEKYNRLLERIKEDPDASASTGLACSLKAKKIQKVALLAEEEMYKNKREFYKNHPDLKRDIFEENLTKEINAVINNFTANYPTVGIIDLKTDNLKIFKIDSTFPLVKKCTNYSDYVKIFKDKYLSQNDLKNLMDFQGSQTLKKYLTNQVSYEISFQIMNGEWRQTVYTTLERKNKCPEKVLFYSQKLNKDLADKLNEEMHIHTEYEILEGLSFDFSLISLINTEKQTFNVYKNNGLPYQLIKVLNTSTFEEAKKWFAETFIVEADRNDFLENVKLDKIINLLKRKKSYSYIFHTTPEFHKTKEPSLSRFMFYRPVKDSTNIVFVTKLIRTKQEDFD